MKKTIVIILLALLASHVTFAQNESESEQKVKAANNELKLNLATTLASLPEINYERILGGNSGLGVAVMFPIESGIDNPKFLFIPYYRFYFGNYRAQGFFLELNAGLKVHKEYDYYSVYYSDSNNDYYFGNFSENNKVDVGLGFAVGYKYVLQKSGLVAEVYTGVGRMTNNQFYPRIGVTLGKRF